MGGNFSVSHTFVNEEILTHTLLNAIEENIKTNFTPAGVDDDSLDATAMQTVVDPFPDGVMSLPTSLQGELQRIRYILKEHGNGPYWYSHSPNAVNVKSYKAKGDGSTDDSAAILAALAAACPVGGYAKTLIMPAGVYAIESEIAPDFDINGLVWKGDGNVRIKWTGAAAPTKAVFRATVTSANDFANTKIENIMFWANGLAGYAFVLEGDGSGGSAAANVFNQAKFEQGTVAGLVLGDSDEPMATDAAVSLNIFNQCTFANSPYNVLINATNAYENTFNQPYMISNLTPKVVKQHFRIAWGEMTRINDVEFGALGLATSGHPHGAADDMYCVYAQSPTAIRGAYSEDRRLLKIVDGGHSDNLQYVLDHVYLNDPQTDANLADAYVVWNTNARLNLKNITPKVGTDTMQIRSDYRMVMENVRYTAYLTVTGARYGTFTMGAAASKTISNTNVSGASNVTITPTNAAAGTLQAGADSLFHSLADQVEGTSFTVKTAGGGNAAGTETFTYEISSGQVE
jgi:hypothetical protein